MKSGDGAGDMQGWHFVFKEGSKEPIRIARGNGDVEEGYELSYRVKNELEWEILTRERFKFMIEEVIGGSLTPEEVSQLWGQRQAWARRN